MTHSHTLKVSLGLLLLFFFLACDRSEETTHAAASTPGTDSLREATLQSLLDADEAWLRAAQVSAESFVSFFADDGHWLYVDGPRMSSREEMLAYASEVWDRPDFTLHWEATSFGVNSSLDVGHTAGKWESSYTAADGQVNETLGSYVAIWKKSESGEWKVTFEIEIFGQGAFQQPTAVVHRQ